MLQLTGGDLHAGYAKPVADVLDPDGNIFAARLYRCSCASISASRNVLCY